MLITLVSREDQIVKERAAEKQLLTLQYFETANLVEVNGIEPMTPCLQSRCSPS